MITLTQNLEPFRAEIEKYYNEARLLLPELSSNMSFEDDNKRIIKGYPTGGYTHSKSLIRLGIDNTWKDKIELSISLRGTIFHELYHVVQGFSKEASKKQPYSAIERAIFEGTATVFERDYTDKICGWAQYDDAQTMSAWVEEVRSIPLGQDYTHLKFFDPNTNRRWVIYKTGVFIVDRALQKSKLDIIDLRNKSVEEILELAQLS